jgi:hypothetical protein
MPRARTPAGHARDAQALELRRRGLTYEQIAAQLGFPTPQSAWQAVRRSRWQA